MKMRLLKYNKVMMMVKGVLLLYLFTFLPLTAHAQTTYQRADSTKICKLLRQADKQATTLWIARQFMGIPYVAHTLEVNDQEQLVVNTGQLDCTTLVETVTALIIPRVYTISRIGLTTSSRWALSARCRNPIRHSRQFRRLPYTI